MDADKTTAEELINQSQTHVCSCNSGNDFPVIRRKFIIPVGSTKRWWQFWKKSNRHNVQEILNLYKESPKTPNDVWIPVKNENKENL